MDNYTLDSINDFRDVLSDILDAPELDSRNGKCRELTGVSLSIRQPGKTMRSLARKEYFLAKVYEAAWVMAGRNDLRYLSKFLPRAADYSDDGITWRGAYGPRLLRYGKYQKNQLEYVIDCFKENINSRQAVVSIYNPDADTGITTKDLPCNNFMQFLIRDNRLNLYVYQRSCDALWGFLGINNFEWAYLMYYMRNWLARNDIYVEVGTHHHFFGSLHIYDKHYDRCKQIVEEYIGHNEFVSDTLIDGVVKCAEGWDALDRFIPDLFTTSDEPERTNMALWKGLELLHEVVIASKVSEATKEEYMTKFDNLFHGVVGPVCMEAFDSWARTGKQPFASDLASELTGEK